MGEKDIAEKILLAYNDVFSDIVNVLLFGGQEIIRENDLEDPRGCLAGAGDCAHGALQQAAEGENRGGKRGEVS